MSQILSNLKAGKDIDWKDWKNKEQESFCDLYISVGFCKRTSNRLTQFTEYNKKLIYIEKNKREFIRTMIVKSEGLRDYLIVHSKFKDDQSQMDWLEKEMHTLLKPNDEDINRIYKSKKMPQELLDKLLIFDPEPISYERDAVRIEYDFYGRELPINIIDEAWENVTHNMVDIASILATFSNIDAGAPQLVGSAFDSEELPF